MLNSQAEQHRTTSRVGHRMAQSVQSQGLREAKPRTADKAETIIASAWGDLERKGYVVIIARMDGGVTRRGRGRAHGPAGLPPTSPRPGCRRPPRTIGRAAVGAPIGKAQLAASRFRSGDRAMHGAISLAILGATSPCKTTVRLSHAHVDTHAHKYTTRIT